MRFSSLFLFLTDGTIQRKITASFRACTSYSAAQKLAYWSTKYGVLYEFRLRKGTMEVSSEIYYFINCNEQCNNIFLNGKMAMGIYVRIGFTESCSYIPWNFPHLWEVFTKYCLYFLKSEDNYLRLFLYMTFYSIFQKEWNMFHKNLNSLQLISQYIL